MSKSKTLLKTDLIFTISIVIFIVLIFLTFKSAEEVDQARELEGRAHNVLQKLQRLLSHALDIETGNRGYAIAGTEEFLKPLEDGKVDLKVTIDSLRYLIIDNEQKQRLDTLELLLKEKLVISETIVSMRRNQGMADALSYISQGEGKRVMDSIRSVIGRAVNKELILLADRSSATDEKRAERGLYFISLFITALLITIIAYIIIRKINSTLLENKTIQEDLIHELSYQNKQLEDFSHIISHNIRGPASNISTLVLMVNQNSPLSEFQLIFSKLEKVSRNLIDSLNELLDIVHLKKNTRIEKTKLSFQEVFWKEKENLEGEILKSKAELYCDFSLAPSIVYSKAYLESIYHNLISNALKYRSPVRSPIIQVKTEQKEGNIFLHVSDNGLGIDLKNFGNKIFGLRKTFHEHPDAKGIGLFMTKTQIETLGGEITVQSEVGEGTTFTVRF
jgi:signal transduction histidine kinase